MGTRNRRAPAPTAAPRRAAVYHRVSSEEQVEGYSLDAQRHATTAYCAAHGWEVTREYRDEGKSAWSDDLAKRPAFARMIADAEAGLVDVVVVHKLDRFSRNLLTTLETLQRLEAAGVGFVSISEAMDFTTPIGKVILATLGAFAEYYSANLSHETKKGKAERKRQGMYNGLLPFGAAKGEDGVPVPHPEDHAGLVLAFELAAQGKTDRAVAQALTAAGYRTTGNRGGNGFSKDTVCRLLQNRFYLGELPDGNGGWIPGKHGPLIDPDLFERAQAARLRNTHRPHRLQTARRSPWALSGLATCAACGRAMTSVGRADGRQRVQCSGRTQGHGCTAPTFYAAHVDAQIQAALADFVLPPAERDLLVRDWAARQTRAKTGGNERASLVRKLDRLREAYLQDELGRAEYQERKAALTRELAALPEDTPRSDDGTGRRLAEYLADVAGAWAAATPAERNALARALFASVLIEDKTPVAVLPRPDLLPFFAARAEKSSEAAPDGPESGLLPGRHPGGAHNADGVCQPGGAGMTYGRKRTGVAHAETHLPAGAVRVAWPGAQLPSGSSGRSSRQHRPACQPALG